MQPETLTDSGTTADASTRLLARASCVSTRELFKAFSSCIMNGYCLGVVVCHLFILNRKADNVFCVIV